MKNPATALGEAALTQLAMRLLDHDRLTTSDLRVLHPTGRHVWLPQIGLRHANALVDLVAVAENFTTKRLLDLYPVVTEYQVSSWENRRKEWKKRGNVDLMAVTPHWDRLIGFIEARNAIQHGLGRLTDMQLKGKRRNEVISSLSAAKISLIGDVVQVESRTVEACHSVCQEFVAALDNAAPASLQLFVTIWICRSR